MDRVVVKYKKVITNYVKTLANSYNLWYNIYIKIKAKAEGELK